MVKVSNLPRVCGCISLTDEEQPQGWANIKPSRVFSCLNTSKGTGLIHFSKSQSRDLDSRSWILEDLSDFIVLLQASLTIIQQGTRFYSIHPSGLCINSNNVQGVLWKSISAMEPSRALIISFSKQVTNKLQGLNHCLT